jgi:hypothetical protein
LFSTTEITLFSTASGDNKTSFVSTLANAFVFASFALNALTLIFTSTEPRRRTVISNDLGVGVGLFLPWAAQKSLFGRPA